MMVEADRGHGQTCEAKTVKSVDLSRKGHVRVREMCQTKRAALTSLAGSSREVQSLSESRLSNCQPFSQSPQETDWH